MPTNIIKQLRKARKMTQQKLADAAGLCSKGYVCDVENGRKEPGVYTALRISKALKKRVEDVFLPGDINAPDIQITKEIGRGRIDSRVKP